MYNLLVQYGEGQENKVTRGTRAASVPNDYGQRSVSGEDRDTQITKDPSMNTRSSAVTFNLPKTLRVCNVPNRYKLTNAETGQEIQLGKWLSDQRTLKKRKQLIPQREAQLQLLVDAGKLDWSIDVYQSDNSAYPFADTLRLLEETMTAHGPMATVPANLVTKSQSNPNRVLRLGRWFRRQVERYIQFQLPKDQHDLLTAFLSRTSATATSPTTAAPGPAAGASLSPSLQEADGVLLPSATSRRNQEGGAGYNASDVTSASTS
eukprot:gene451-478_t